MTDEVRSVKLVIVAFRVDEENSIGYVKLTTPDDGKIGAFVNRMIHEKGADFLSIRATDKKEAA